MSPSTLLADVRHRFFAEIDTAVHPAPGLFTLLDRLRQNGLPLAVATSSRRAYAERLLTQHRLIDRFRFVLGSEDVSRGKPDPEIYTRCHRAAGCPRRFRPGAGRQPRGGRSRPEGGRPGGRSAPRA